MQDMSRQAVNKKIDNTRRSMATKNSLMDVSQVNTSFKIRKDDGRERAMSVKFDSTRLMERRPASTHRRIQSKKRVDVREPEIMTSRYASCTPAQK